MRQGGAGRQPTAGTPPVHLPCRCCLPSPSPAVSKAFGDFVESVREEAAKAQDALAKYTEAHPDGLLARLGGNHNNKRRLQSLSTLNLMIDRQQERMQVITGGIWGRLGLGHMWRSDGRRMPSTGRHQPLLHAALLPSASMPSPFPSLDPPVTPAERAGVLPGHDGLQLARLGALQLDPAQLRLEPPGRVR